MPNILIQLYAEHKGKVSDKWKSYLYEYEKIFSGYRNAPVRFLEIGVQNGGSLEIWREYFSQAHCLIGCDINRSCLNLEYNDPKIHVVVGDATDLYTATRILDISRSFDIIIDDGSHTSTDIIKTFTIYFPLLVDGSVYVIEDLHCSYWKEYEGGLYDPFSALSFFKRLSDVIGHEHWGIKKTRSELLSGFAERFNVIFEDSWLEHIHSIKFVNSMCIVEKSSPINNQLGFRVVSGHTATVDDGLLTIKEIAIKLVAPPQNENLWSYMDIAPDEAYTSLQKTKSEADVLINSLDLELQRYQKTLSSILTSRSWRITFVFRKISNYIRRFRR